MDKSFNGAEAIKKIENNFSLLYSQKTSISTQLHVRCGHHIPYSVIITNINLPIVNGLELARKLKQIKYENRDALSQFKDIKIVAIANEDNQSKMKEFDYFLTKPLDQQKIKAMLVKFDMQDP